MASCIYLVSASIWEDSIKSKPCKYYIFKHLAISVVIDSILVDISI